MIYLSVFQTIIMHTQYIKHQFGIHCAFHVYAVLLRGLKTKKDSYMKIGFIGFGEAAYNISFGLRQEGVEGIIASDKMTEHAEIGPKIRDRAQEAGVTLMGSAKEVAGQTDIVFVAVPAVNATEVFQEIVDSLRPEQLYIDVCSTSPSVKKTISTGVERIGALYVDAAMLGSLPLKKHQVPITASGSGAHLFKETMSPFGMDISTIGTEAGAASAVKLIRSIFMKGIAGLMLEMLQGAHEYHVIDEVVESISKSMDGIPFESHLNRLITGTATHARRRGAELNGSIQMLSERYIDNAMTIAAQHKHEMLAETFTETLLKTDNGNYRDTVAALSNDLNIKREENNARRKKNIFKTRYTGPETD